MARISDKLLVQLAEGSTADEDVLVVIDESAGSEITIPRAVWPQFLAATRYLTGL